MGGYMDGLAGFGVWERTLAIGMSLNINLSDERE
jgi:hypothetical protein